MKWLELKQKLGGIFGLWVCTPEYVHLNLCTWIRTHLFWIAFEKKKNNFFLFYVSESFYLKESLCLKFFLFVLWCFRRKMTCPWCCTKEPWMRPEDREKLSWCVCMRSVSGSSTEICLFCCKKGICIYRFVSFTSEWSFCFVMVTFLALLLAWIQVFEYHG